MKDTLNIKRRYFSERKLLACSITYKALAEKFDTNVRTIARWLKILSDLGYIKIEKLKVGGKQERNVFILGTHEMFTDTNLFLEEN